MRRKASEEDEMEPDECHEAKAEDQVVSDERKRSSKSRHGFVNRSAYLPYLCFVSTSMLSFLGTQGPLRTGMQESGDEMRNAYCIVDGIL